MDEKCEHIYKNMGTEICVICHKPTHEIDWVKENAMHRKWLKDNPDAWKQVGWWSI